MADNEKRGMTLDDWVKAACAELDIARSDAPVSLVLNLARDVAHNTVRPAAPVTAFLLGLAVGRGADPQQAATRLSALAAAQADHGASDGERGTL